MDKEKIRELETLLDGLEFNLTDLKQATTNLEKQINWIKEVLQDKQEEF